MIMIEFKKVSYTYYSKFYSLLEFSYQFNDGNYALIGDNISGGLTIIRLLAKLDWHYKGEILINGTSLKKTNYKKHYNVAYISAIPKFFEHKTVLANVAYALKIRGVNRRERNNIALVTLANWGWKDKANMKVKSLTNPDRITLALIRANTRKLDLLLCEDIFNVITPDALDKINATTKIVVTQTGVELDNYTPLLFGIELNKKQG